jgi:general secretion pathway protein D
LLVGGGPYTVPLSINGASQVTTVSLTLTFDPLMLRVRTVQEGSFMRQGSAQVTFSQQVDGTAGRVDIILTRTADATGASGSGLLAAIQFDAIAPGSVMLTPSGVAMTPGGAPINLQLSPVLVNVR